MSGGDKSIYIFEFCSSPCLVQVFKWRSFISNWNAKLCCTCTLWSVCNPSAAPAGFHARQSIRCLNGVLFSFIWSTKIFFPRQQHKLGSQVICRTWCPRSRWGLNNVWVLGTRRHSRTLLDPSMWWCQLIAELGTTSQNKWLNTQTHPVFSFQCFSV